MAELRLVVGTKRFSSWSLRPYLALAHAGLPFDEVEIALRQPQTKDEIRRFSPSGKVPLLIGPDGLRVWDSLAICETIAELAPEAGLWPHEANMRAYARAFSAEMHAGFAALRQHLPMDLLLSEVKTDLPAEVMADIERICEIWRDCLNRSGGPYLFGRFTIADCMFAPVATRFVSYGVPLEPPIQAYVEAIFAVPALQKWIAACR